MEFISKIKTRNDKPLNHKHAKDALKIETSWEKKGEKNNFSATGINASHTQQDITL